MLHPLYNLLAAGLGTFTFSSCVRLKRLVQVHIAESLSLIAYRISIFKLLVQVKFLRRMCIVHEGLFRPSPHRCLPSVYQSKII